MAASMAPNLVSSEVVWAAITPLRRSILASMERVCALMAASMTASLASRVLLTALTASMIACNLVCWSAFIWSMACLSWLMACSFLRAPLLMASTTLVKSLTTVTSILYFRFVASSSHELKKTGVASSMAPANMIDFNTLIVICVFGFIFYFFTVMVTLRPS